MHYTDKRVYWIHKRYFELTDSGVDSRHAMRKAVREWEDGEEEIIADSYVPVFHAGKYGY